MGSRWWPNRLLPFPIPESRWPMCLRFVVLHKQWSARVLNSRKSLTKCRRGAGRGPRWHVPNWLWRGVPVDAEYRRFGIYGDTWTLKSSRQPFAKRKMCIWNGIGRRFFVDSGRHFQSRLLHNLRLWPEARKGRHRTNIRQHSTVF